MEISLDVSSNGFREKCEADGDSDVSEGYDKTSPISILILCVAAYASLYLAFGDTFLPVGTGWSILLALASSHVLAAVCAKIKIPPMIGMLFSGMVLRNLPDKPIDSLTDSWSSGIRAFGLSVILLRSGLEMDFDALRKRSGLASRLTMIPAFFEAVTSGIASMAIFGMPLFLGFSQGFILAAVSPAVVVTGMLRLQEKGIGTAKGIPSLIIAAASLDDVFAITGFSLFIGLAVPHGPMIWNLLHGPLNIILGVIGGGMSGFLCSKQALFRTRLEKLLSLLLLAMVTMFLAKRFHFPGSGALASLISAIVAQKTWVKQEGPSKDTGQVVLKRVEKDLGLLWKWFSQPLLFCVIGAEVSFANITASTVPKAVAVTLVGLMVRLPAAFVAVSGGHLSTIEKAFVALSWVPKATVQAALASIPLELIEEYKKESTTYMGWGEDIVTVAVVSIILTAPVGVFIINVLGPRMLSHSATKYAPTKSPPPTPVTVSQK